MEELLNRQRMMDSRHRASSYAHHAVNLQRQMELIESGRRRTVSDCRPLLRTRPPAAPAGRERSSSDPPTPELVASAPRHGIPISESARRGAAPIAIQSQSADQEHRNWASYSSWGSTGFLGGNASLRNSFADRPGSFRGSFSQQSRIRELERGFEPEPEYRSNWAPQEEGRSRSNSDVLADWSPDAWGPTHAPTYRQDEGYYADPRGGFGPRDYYGASMREYYSQPAYYGPRDYGYTSGPREHSGSRGYGYARDDGYGHHRDYEGRHGDYGGYGYNQSRYDGYGPPQTGRGFQSGGKGRPARDSRPPPGRGRGATAYGGGAARPPPKQPQARQGQAPAAQTSKKTKRGAEDPYSFAAFLDGRGVTIDGDDPASRGLIMHHLREYLASVTPEHPKRCVRNATRQLKMLERREAQDTGGDVPES
eukprot:TRINITY_DN9508_c0_g1_i2.p1 TRINITY_DN9508_c0_g1~~TRINITY_DN9508_c0_g1_i2.p1  ORF type:complete len:423 (+),score=41.60 TRINITY_DN9508_c0_g1_i2:93-1361(+)